MVTLYFDRKMKEYEALNAFEERLLETRHANLRKSRSINELEQALVAKNLLEAAVRITRRWYDAAHSSLIEKIVHRYQYPVTPERLDLERKRVEISHSTASKYLEAMELRVEALTKQFCEETTEDVSTKLSDLKQQAFVTSLPEAIQLMQQRHDMISSSLTGTAFGRDVGPTLRPLQQRLNRWSYDNYTNQDEAFSLVKQSRGMRTLQTVSLVFGLIYLLGASFYIFLYAVQVEDNKVIRSVGISVLVSNAVESFIVSPCMHFALVGIIPMLLGRIIAPDVLNALDRFRVRHSAVGVRAPHRAVDEESAISTKDGSSDEEADKEVVGFGPSDEEETFMTVNPMMIADELSVVNIDAWLEGISPGNGFGDTFGAIFRRHGISQQSDLGNTPLAVIPDIVRELRMEQNSSSTIEKVLGSIGDVVDHSDLDEWLEAIKPGKRYADRFSKAFCENGIYSVAALSMASDDVVLALCSRIEDRGAKASEIKRLKRAIKAPLRGSQRKKKRHKKTLRESPREFGDEDLAYEDDVVQPQLAHSVLEEGVREFGDEDLAYEGDVVQDDGVKNPLVHSDLDNAVHSIKEDVGNEARNFERNVTRLVHDVEDAINDEIATIGNKAQHAVAGVTQLVHEVEDKVNNEIATIGNKAQHAVAGVTQLVHEVEDKVNDEIAYALGKQAPQVHHAENEKKGGKGSGSGSRHVRSQRFEDEEQAIDEHFWKKIHSAARWGKLGALQDITPPRHANIADPKNGNRVIHIGAQNGHLEVVEYLISVGADVDARNKAGQTAFHMAVEYDYYEIIQVLIAAGADHTATNRSGHEARTGLIGKKCVAFVAFVAASTAEELKASLQDLLNVVTSGQRKLVDKATFAQTGLRHKRERKAEWVSDPLINNTFVKIIGILQEEAQGEIDAAKPRDETSSATGSAAKAKKNKRVATKAEKQKKTKKKQKNRRADLEM